MSFRNAANNHSRLIVQKTKLKDNKTPGIQEKDGVSEL